MKKANEKVRGRIAFAYLFLYYILPIGLIMNQIKIDSSFAYVFVLFSAAIIFAITATHLDNTFPISISGILFFLLPPLINSALFIFFFGFTKFRQDIFIQGALLFIGALCGFLITELRRFGVVVKKHAIKKSELRWIIAILTAFIIAIFCTTRVLLSYATTLEGNDTWIFLSYAFVSIFFLAKEHYKVMKGKEV